MDGMDSEGEALPSMRKANESFVSSLLSPFSFLLTPYSLLIPRHALLADPSSAFWTSSSSCETWKGLNRKQCRPSWLDRTIEWCGS
jgi:hypothetical protein